MLTSGSGGDGTRLTAMLPLEECRFEVTLAVCPAGQSLTTGNLEERKTRRNVVKNLQEASQEAQVVILSDEDRPPRAQDHPWVHVKSFIDDCFQRGGDRMHTETNSEAINSWCGHRSIEKN